MITDTVYLKRAYDTGGATQNQWNDYRWQLKHAITTLEKAHDFFNIPASLLSLLQKTAARYHFSLTPYALSLIEPENPRDPILLQSFPHPDEVDPRIGGDPDPLDEEGLSPLPRLTHRYRDRVLINVSNLCPFYCRHCNRKRNWSRPGSIITKKEIKEIASYLSRHPEVTDCLISGGDPLMLSNALLEYLLDAVHSVGHIEIIRIGSRIPVTLPQRIDRELARRIASYGPVWLNTQFNHPSEITSRSAAAIEILIKAGIPINNQTVLLRGINDSAEIVELLNRRLLSIRVRPYYLFQLDRARGAVHFQTPVALGARIVENMRGKIAGLGIPVFAVDCPGGGGKVAIGSEAAIVRKANYVLLTNYEKKHYLYPDIVGSQ